MLTTYLKDFEAGALEARGWPTHFSAYRMGLVAMNAYSRIIARRHHELCINCANPGYIKTDMSVYTGTLTPAEGANNLLKVLLLPQGGPTGKYFDEGTEAPFV
jgi:(+)-neomenthol dehydrogenase